MAIARNAVDGRVTDVGVERKYGEITWVVEIQDDEETDVVISIETGEVLGI